MIYTARFDVMNALVAFLTENCCQGQPEEREPAESAAPPRRKRTA